MKCASVISCWSLADRPNIGPAIRDARAMKSDAAIALGIDKAHQARDVSLAVPGLICGQAPAILKARQLFRGYFKYCQHNSRRRTLPLIYLTFAVWVTSAILAYGATTGATFHTPTRPATAKMTFIGAPRPALNWQKCDQIDIPDAGLRAFRNVNSQVVAIASHYKTRILEGPSLLDLKKLCPIALDSAADAAPAAHDDRTWLASVWTSDGVHIVGIGHDEYHGEAHPGRCLGTTARQCRYGTLVFLNSQDGGADFERMPTRPLAAVPVRQAPNLGRDTGFFQPSNIFHWGNAEYVFVRTTGGGAQEPATCLLRSEKPLDPDSWQIYDGKSFITQRFDPYLDNPAKYVPCANLPGLNGMVWSVLTYEPTGTLIALLTIVDPTTHASRLALSTASDPLHWTRAAAIQADFFGLQPSCGKDGIYWYPSLIDPASKSRNFDTTGANPVLFLTHIKLVNCKMTMTRDLYYVPAHLSIE